MSTTQAVDVGRAIEGCRPEDVTPVCIDAASLDSTAPEYLRDLKWELGREGFLPARVTVEACFDADCTFATQDEVDRIRTVIRVAAFLGAGTVTVAFDAVANEEKLRPALLACAERARREGVTLELEGPLALES